MIKSLKNVNRVKVIDDRDYNSGIFLNRAERVEPIKQDIIENILKESNLFGNLGYYYDTEVIYDKYSKYLKINKNELLITNGAEEAIRYIFNLLLTKNDKIMFPSPTYGMYHVYNKIYQTEALILEYNDNFKIDKEKLYSNLNSIKVFFLPNPSHIEDIFDETEIENICKILKNNKGYLVVDETYYGFGSDSMIELINSIENIFIIRSFSKTFGLPSIRVGCLIGNEKNMKIISNYRAAYEISYPSLKIAEYFLDNIDIVNNYIQECIEGRKYLIDELDKNKIIYNGTSNYLLNIKINNSEVCNKICSNLEKKKIYVRNCKTYISITIGPIKYMKIFFNNFKLNIIYNK